LKNCEISIILAPKNAFEKCETSMDMTIFFFSFFFGGGTKANERGGRRNRNARPCARHVCVRVCVCSSEGMSVNVCSHQVNNINK